MLHQNFKQINMRDFFVSANFPKTPSPNPARIPPQTLLFHLRHPNSKTDEPKFWQILSPKNSFAKTSSALFRHLPEYLEGRTPKKNVLSIFKKNFTPAKIKKARDIFLWGCWRTRQCVGLSPNYLFWK